VAGISKTGLPWATCLYPCHMLFASHNPFPTDIQADCAVTRQRGALCLTSTIALTKFPLMLFVPMHR
jgi:hypothetical protein